MKKQMYHFPFPSKIFAATLTREKDEKVSADAGCFSVYYCVWLNALTLQQEQCNTLTEEAGVAHEFKIMKDLEAIG